MRWILGLVVLALSINAGAEELQPGIVVLGKGWVEAEPDMLRLELSIRNTAEDLASASTRADKLTRQAVQLARDSGITVEHIDSSTLRSWPEYEWRDNRRHLLGITVQRDIILKVLDLASYPQLVDQLSRLPLTQIQQPQLGHQNLAQLKLQALANAIQHGRSKADFMAEELGVAVGDVLSAEEQFSANSRPVPMMRAEMATDSAAAPSFNFGVRRIESQVRLRYSVVRH